MADRALVSIFFRQIAVGRTSCGFAGTILPRHIGQSGSRAGFHAFRFAVAKEALAGFLFFAVEAHHVPRTGFLAEPAIIWIGWTGAGAVCIKMRTSLLLNKLKRVTILTNLTEI